MIVKHFYDLFIIYLYKLKMYLIEAYLWHFYGSKGLEAPSRLETLQAKPMKSNIDNSRISIAKQLDTESALFPIAVKKAY